VRARVHSSLTRSKLGVMDKNVIINNTNIVRVGCRHGHGFWRALFGALTVMFLLTWPVAVWPGSPGVIVAAAWNLFLLTVVCALALFRRPRA
jgi:hypothetical protein